MIVRERLLGEMSTLAAETKWEDALGEILAEMFEVRPSNPYLFLQKKASLRQKMDNSKTSHYLIELTLYITHIDPLLASEEAIKDKIISLCVEKFQHTKIKKTEIMQLVNVALLQTDPSRREIFVKLLQSMLDREIYTILEYADILYRTVLYRAVIGEVSKLQKRLGELKIELSRAALVQWVNTINEQSSITKQLGLQLEEADIFKGIANEIASKIAL